VTPSVPAAATPLTPEEAQRKYAEERAKRLRADGLDQYVHLEGDLERFAEDPWAETDGSRDPIEATVDAVLLGAGLANLQMAVWLREVGLERIMMIDKAADVGGTWYWNRYPGAQCDTESHVYLPLLEETGYIPTEKYARQPEILEHCRRIARHFDLYRDAVFQTEVQEARWDDTDSRWVISTNRGDTIRSRYFIVAPGRLQNPKLPGIKGIESFRGRSWHTSRWDHAFTGENLENLADKRVGVIGTGATGIQVVPRLAEAAKEVFVFQRTPAAPWARNNAPTPEDFGKDLEPGWQYRRMWNFTAVSTGFPAPDGEPDMVQDGWTEIAQFLASATAAGKPLQHADLEVMERIRNRVDEVVEDPYVASALKPYYSYGCKRPNFHDEFLTAFNRPNVHLVDTDGRGPDEITEHAVVVDGQAYEVDALVFATGFDLGMGFLYGTGLRIIGRSGELLSDKWSEGLRTLHGMHTHDYPNAFFFGFTQTAFSVSYTHMALEQTKHAAHVIAEAERRGAVVEATREAEDEYVHYVRSRSMSPKVIAALNACTPAAGNNEGNAADPNTLAAGRFLPAGNTFFEMLRDWRDAGDFAGLTLAPRNSCSGQSVS
jgi:cation diffusion facilitator CzcD-associated flavoprotein CzcO